MVIGYLQLGLKEDGVPHVNYLFAQEARLNNDIEVIEFQVVLSHHWRADRLQLLKGASVLSRAEVVQVQFTENVWGFNLIKRIVNLLTFFVACKAPVFTTIHDTPHFPYEKLCYCQDKNKHFFLKHSIFLRKIINQLLSWIRLIYYEASKEAWLRRLVFLFSAKVFVHNKTELKRLYSIVYPKKNVSIIPMFSVERSIKCTFQEARQKLGLSNYKVITLLGFIYGGKGYELLLEALTFLPEHVIGVFAGGCAYGNKTYVDKLLVLAERLNVASRLRITGYLREEELEDYLMATDVPVVPYSVCSASAGMSTWISARRPILAADLPQFREYNEIVENAIRIFKPYNSQALAQSIQAIIENPTVVFDQKIEQLHKHFSIHKIFNLHFDSYVDFLKTNNFIRCKYPTSV